MWGRFRPDALGRLPLILLAGLLAAGVGAAQEDLDWQSPDGSFPDHGGCRYFGPEGGLSPVGTAASDFAAMKLRTRNTESVLAMMPQRRNGGIIPRSAAATANPGACAGIDDCIQKTADAAGVPLTYLTTDAEFLRRARLDLTGRIPTKDEVLAFLADTSSTKREQLVDRLLQTPEWADRWTMFFGDHFRNTRITAQVNRYNWGRDSFHLYLRDSLLENKPYDQMAREMLAAEGVSDGRTYPERYTSFQHWQQTYRNLNDNPVRPSAVGYVVGGRTIGGPIQDTYDTLAFFTARDFLGISVMDCVLCHDGAGHLEPLTVWGAAAQRSEAWGLAAFFSDVPRFQSWRYPGNQRPLNPSNGRRVNTNYYMLNDLARGQRQRARYGDTAGEYLGQTSGGNRPDRLSPEQFVTPAYPFASEAVVDSSMRLREQVGWHLTSDPQFARAAVNFIWRAFFSRGIVEPADQFDLARLDPGSPPPAGWDIQPSHPQLLEWLAEGFQDNGFDLKWLMREITTSQAYQLSSRYEGVFNPLHEKYFVRHQVKRLTAEQVVDAVMVASNQYTSFRGSDSLRNVDFAMQLSDVNGVPLGNNLFARNVRGLLDSFTRGDREETQRSGEGSPLQALGLMNNRFVLNRLNRNNQASTLGQSVQMADDALVTNLYLSVLSRPPTAEETAFGVNYLQGGNRGTRATNLMWALFNKTDFYFNY